MERLSSCKVDELGRICLLSELRKEPGLGVTGQHISLFYVNKTTLNLQITEAQVEDALVKLEELKHSKP